MEPIAQDPVVIYHMNQVCLGGKRELEYFDSSKTTEEIDNLVNCKRVSTNFLGKSEFPKEKVYVFKNLDSYAFPDYPHLVVHVSDQGLDWQPRNKLIQLAIQDRLIFAISFIPINPETKQDWYFKKNVQCLTVDDSVAENIKIVELLQYLPSQDRPFEAVSLISNQAFSFLKAKVNKPSEVFTGFFKPYPTFSSDLAAAEFDPNHLPANVTKANVFSENEVNLSLAKIKNHDLRDRVNGIIIVFIEDFQAKGMGLTILQAPRGITLYFSKELTKVDSSKQI